MLASLRTSFNSLKLSLNREKKTKAPLPSSLNQSTRAYGSDGIKVEGQRDGGQCYASTALKEEAQKAPPTKATGRKRQGHLLLPLRNRLEKLSTKEKSETLKDNYQAYLKKRDEHFQKLRSEGRTAEADKLESQARKRELVGFGTHVKVGMAAVFRKVQEITIDLAFDHRINRNECAADRTQRMADNLGTMAEYLESQVHEETSAVEAKKPKFSSNNPYRDLTSPPTKERAAEDTLPVPPKDVRASLASSRDCPLILDPKSVSYFPDDLHGDIPIVLDEMEDGS